MKLAISLVFIFIALSVAQELACTQSTTHVSFAESGTLGCSSYGDRLTISWAIEPSDESLRILLTFTEFDTEANYDFVRIYDGNSQDAPLIGSFSGSVVPGPFSSSGNQMLVVFTADEYVEGGGFVANWSSFTVEDGITPCSTSQSQEIEANEGSFGCDGYANSISVSWLLTGSPGERLALHFEVFNTERTYDVVTVYDGANGNAEIIGTYSGSDVPPPVTSTGNQLYVTFVSDYSLTTTGFTATFNSVVQFSDPCYNNTNQILLAREGYVGCPYGYGNNVNSTWLINILGNVVIRLNFLSMDTEENFDFVSVYDGNSFGAPLLGTFSGTTTPDPITSSGSRLLVALTSDGTNVGEGFTASYESVHALQPAGCSRSGTFILTEPEDSIGCEGYLSGVIEEWHIQAQGEIGDQIINLTWQSFATQTGDIVTVYDGNSTSATILQEASGNTIPDPVVSSGQWLLVRFVANVDNVNGAGFSAVYESVPVETTPQSCQTSNSFYLTAPADVFGCDGYGNNVEVSWQIHVDEGFLVLLSFDTFFTEALFDFVTIYDGPDEESEALGSFSGAFRPPDISSSSNYLLVVLTSDGGGTRAGFTAEYQSVFSGSDADSCFSSQSHFIDEPSGTFGCSGYGNDVEVTWSFSSPSGTTIAVDFVSFQTEANNDFLRFYDGSNSNSREIGTFSGYAIPPQVQSTSNHLYVTFTSDSSIQYDGFTAEFHDVEDQSSLETCTSSTHETLTAPTGNFGCDKYGNSIDSSWLIQVAEQQRITLEFTELSTELYYDYIKVFDGSSTHDTLLGTYSGDVPPPAITSAGNELYVTFHSDSSVSSSYDGFFANYVSFGSFLGSCSTNAVHLLTASSGSFGCDGYDNSITVTWSISSFGNIFVNFDQFDTERNYDIVYIYDGPNDTSPLLAQYSGSTATPVTSSGTEMYIVFTSDSSINRAGFSASYDTIIVNRG